MAGDSILCDFGVVGEVANGVNGRKREDEVTGDIVDTGSIVAIKCRRTAHSLVGASLMYILTLV